MSELIKVEKSKLRRKRTPIQATHEVRYAIVKRKSRAGVEYTSYKPLVLPKKGVKIEPAEPNRKQRRADKAFERGQAMRDRKAKIRDAHDLNKLKKMQRIEKRHEENRKRSAARREAKKNQK